MDGLLQNEYAVLHNIVVVIRRGVVYIIYKGVVKVSQSHCSCHCQQVPHFQQCPHCPAPDGLNPEAVRLEIFTRCSVPIRICKHETQLQFPRCLKLNLVPFGVQLRQQALVSMNNKPPLSSACMCAIWQGLSWSRTLNISATACSNLREKSIIIMLHSDWSM